MTLKASTPGSDFYFDIPVNTEGATRYVLGGYHPAIAGDILGDSPQRQYRLMHKLGWGSSATVWIAETTDETKTYVAVKITTAEGDNDGKISHEIEMFQKAANTQPDDGPFSHVLKLLDHFKIHGPNGTHIVIVTEVVVPILLVLSKQSPAWRKAAAYGVAQAMAQLHAKQIVHGDWHLGNIGIAMPQLADQDCEDVMLELSPHEVTVVLPRDPSKQTASLPTYLLLPCDIAAYYQKIAGSDHPQAKIFDLGSAHEIGTRPRLLQDNLVTGAPETISARVFGSAFDLPADVCALGSTIYQIVTDSVLFDGVDMPNLPFQMSKLVGQIRSHWKKWPASLSDRNITQTDSDEWWASRWEILRRGCENDEDADALVRLLKTVFILDPKDRPTATQIVNDPWFQSVTFAGITPPKPLKDG